MLYQCSVGLYLKAETEKEVKLLLKLKEDFHVATGQEWKPDQQPAAVAGGAKEKQSAQKEPVKETPAPSGATSSGEAAELKVKIDAQGNRVRELKTSGSSKVKITLDYFYHCPRKPSALSPRWVDGWPLIATSGLLKASRVK